MIVGLVVSEDVGEQPPKNDGNKWTCVQMHWEGKPIQQVFEHGEDIKTEIDRTQLKSTCHLERFCETNQPIIHFASSGNDQGISNLCWWFPEVMYAMEKNELSQRYPLAIKHGDGKFRTTLDSLDGFPIVFE